MIPNRQYFRRIEAAGSTIETLAEDSARAATRYRSRREARRLHWEPRLGVGDARAGLVALPGIGGLVVGGGAEFGILHDGAGAGVPAQDGGVVAWGAEFGGGFVVGHGGAQRVVGGGVAAVVDAGVAHAFPDDAGIIFAFVVAFNFGEDFLGGFGVDVGLELVGAGEEQGDQRLLVVGDDRQDVETNTFGEVRLVQQAVAFDFGERFGNALRRDGFQFEVHEASYASFWPNILNKRVSGSKKRSTTRSLSGMMALSVMVMFSGQTLVQHLVMLQRPMPKSFRSWGMRSAVSSGCISSAAA